MSLSCKSVTCRETRAIYGGPFGAPPKGAGKSVPREICQKVSNILSVPLPTIQSEAWLVHAKVRETHLTPGSYELSWLFPLKQGREAEGSYEPSGSDVVRELSREPAMFLIGLSGEVPILVDTFRRFFTLCLARKLSKNQNWS